MCVYLGVPPTPKGHKCMSMDGRIVVSKDDVFNEHDFPFKNGFQIGNHSCSTIQSHEAQFLNVLI